MVPRLVVVCGWWVWEERRTGGRGRPVEEEGGQAICSRVSSSRKKARSGTGSTVTEKGFVIRKHPPPVARKEEPVVEGATAAGVAGIDQAVERWKALLERSR